MVLVKSTQPPPVSATISRGQVTEVRGSRTLGSLFSSSPSRKAMPVAMPAASIVRMPEPRLESCITFTFGLGPKAMPELVIMLGILLPPYLTLSTGLDGDLCDAVGINRTSRPFDVGHLDGVGAVSRSLKAANHGIGITVVRLYTNIHCSTGRGSTTLALNSAVASHHDIAGSVGNIIRIALRIEGVSLNDFPNGDTSDVGGNSGIRNGRPLVGAFQDNRLAKSNDRVCNTILNDGICRPGRRARVADVERSTDNSAGHFLTLLLVVRIEPLSQVHTEFIVGILGRLLLLAHGILCTHASHSHHLTILIVGADAHLQGLCKSIGDLLTSLGILDAGDDGLDSSQQSHRIVHLLRIDGDLFLSLFLVFSTAAVLQLTQSRHGSILDEAVLLQHLDHSIFDLALHAVLLGLGIFILGDLQGIWIFIAKSILDVLGHLEGILGKLFGNGFIQGFHLKQEVLDGAHNFSIISHFVSSSTISNFNRLFECFDESVLRSND